MQFQLKRIASFNFPNIPIPGAVNSKGVDRAVTPPIFCMVADEMELLICGYVVNRVNKEILGKVNDISK